MKLIINGPRLRQLRQRKKKTLRQMADELSMSAQKLCWLESGKVQIRLEGIGRIAQYHGVPYDQLLKWSDE